MSMKVIRALTIILVVGLTGVTGRGVAQAGGGKFTTIDDPNGVYGTWDYIINSLGDIVGYYGDSTSAHGFLLHQGNYTTIDDPNGVQGTFAQGINLTGDIVGYYNDST